MLVDEIFLSIQGEGKHTGEPTVFIRFYGCNLNCVYCDQPQKKENARKMNIENILKEVRKHRVKTVCITGGEPLKQKNVGSLIYSLLDGGFNVSIETNGSVAIPEDNYLRSFSYCMDIKCPSSMDYNKNKFSNLKKLHTQDEVKFVIKDREDYIYAKQVIKKYPTRAALLFSPMFDEEYNQDIGKDLASWLLEDRIENARIQIQLHKVLGVL